MIDCDGKANCVGPNTRAIITCPENTTPLQVKGTSMFKPDSIVCIPNTK